MSLQSCLCTESNVTDIVTKPKGAVAKKFPRMAKKEKALGGTLIAGDTCTVLSMLRESSK